MSKKIILSDTNIIIYLGVGEVFEKFCLEFDLYVTEDVVQEIDNGRASRMDTKSIFYQQYQQGRIQTIFLSISQKKLRDDLMGPKTNIGLGESSTIAVAYDEPNYICATDDIAAIEVALDFLDSAQIVTCEEILAALLARNIIDDSEVELVRKMMNS